jgi:hypothetical protein
MSVERKTPDYDSDAWQGDAELLRGHEDLLMEDEDAASATFYSKREAFSAGYFLGYEAGTRPAAEEGER